MEEKNKSSSPENSTPEIPSNSPPPEAQPVKARSAGGRVSEDRKHRQRMNGVKIAYAFALLLAFGGALVAKLATENSLGNLKTPIEGNYVTITSTAAPTQLQTEPDFQVRHNVTDVPDTREATEAPRTVTTTQQATTQSEYAVPYKDYYTLPLGTDILKDYNPTTPSYNATMGDWRTHGGVDFKGPDGSQIKSIAAGTVTDIADDPMYGTVITIDHGNEVVAKYCGLNKDVTEVSEGDKVKSGQLLGYLGEIPCEKADVSHLHLEVYYKGENVDPLSLMNK
ncbi:MAG: M23 family metallopeptidase [Clostridia bacterium]|nr:M23 family metallopeptidase [Clostridia bacterium]